MVPYRTVFHFSLPTRSLLHDAAISYRGKSPFIPTRLLVQLLGCGRWVLACVDVSASLESSRETGWDAASCRVPSKIQIYGRLTATPNHGPRLACLAPRYEIAIGGALPRHLGSCFSLAYLVCISRPISRTFSETTPNNDPLPPDDKIRDRAGPDGRKHCREGCAFGVGLEDEGTSRGGRAGGCGRLLARHPLVLYSLTTMCR